MIARLQVLLLIVTPAVFCAEPPALSAADKEKAAALVKELGSDEFDKRESATRAVSAMGLQYLSLFRQALKDSDDPETRTRLKRIVEELDRTDRLKKFITEADGDPNVLVREARNLRSQGHVKDSADLFLLAAKAFNKRAEEVKDTRAKQRLIRQALDCEAQAENDSRNGNGAVMMNGRVIFGNGVRIINGGQVRIQVGEQVIDE